MLARLLGHRWLVVLVGIGCFICIAAGLWSWWQQRQYWSDCTRLARGTGAISWYQGASLSFGYPSQWQAASCGQGGDADQMIASSPAILYNLQGRPIGATTLKLVSESRGDRSLAKELSSWRNDGFEGQRSFDTVRVDGHDGLMIVDRPANSQHQITTIILDGDQRRYRLEVANWAVTEQQRQQMEQANLNGQTAIDVILDTMRLD